MELALGTEPRQEYLSFELAAAARKLVEQVMLAKPGENIVITADTSTDWRVVQETAYAAFAAGGTPTVVWPAAAHTDGVVLSPTIALDGVPMEQNGVYVHPELVRACQELGVPGY